MIPEPTTIYFNLDFVATGTLEVFRIEKLFHVDPITNTITGLIDHEIKIHGKLVCHF